jgi:hypothetical protein
MTQQALIIGADSAPTTDYDLIERWDAAVSRYLVTHVV